MSGDITRTVLVFLVALPVVIVVVTILRVFSGTY